MKKTILLFVAIIALSSCNNINDPLTQGFKNPPSEAKARTWWHWINGNVTKEGITADLKAMKQVGIQEAQIFNVDQGYPEGAAEFLSPQWLDLFHFAVSEAKRLGLEIGFHNGAGWSSSGGPWVTPEYAMQTVVFSETHCKGGVLIQEKLPQPSTKFDYYKDIAVLAFPTPENDTRLNNRELKTLSGHSFPNHLYPDAKLIPQTALINKSDILNITSKMLADGTLNWDAPVGKWTILRIGHTPNGTENRPANKSGRGLECDKLSKAAVDVFWAGAITPILEKLGTLGSHLTNCLIDSYEVGCGNWTSGFEKEFLQRCMYDCMSFLPTLAGYYVENGEISERFLWDYRRTIGDLMSENYYGYFSELCHKHGMKFSVEPYGGPFECLQVGAVSDIPMSEFWVGGKVFNEMSKLAASIAHLNGTQIVGAESFTANSSNSRWLNHSATMKPLGDWIWSEGVNRFIFHTYVHQPWNVVPGMTFHMYGTEISRLNTWWKQGKAYMDYIARSQFLLQQGRCVADVLVFTGEASPNDGIYRADIKALGYDYDEIGTNKIMSLTVKDGIIRTSVGGEYRVLVLPDTEWMTPALLKKLKELAKDGATIIGVKPFKSPSLKNFPQCDNESKQLADELWGIDSESKTLIQNISVKIALNQISLPPDFSGGINGSDLIFIHRVTDDADIYFVANQQKQSRTETCWFRVAGKQPELWNPETGTIEPIAVWQSDDKGTNIPLNFNSEESFFIVFKKPIESTNNYIVDADINLQPSENIPLPKLKILKAEYGYFLPDGIADVTGVLQSHINNGRQRVLVNNSLAPDPAPGVVKKLLVEYRLNGQMHKTNVIESQAFIVPVHKTENFQLIKALYGRFPSEFTDSIMHLPQPLNITQHIDNMIVAKEMVFTVNGTLAGETTSDKGKKLHIVYSVEDEVFDITTSEGQEINLLLYTPQSAIVVEKGKTKWVTPQTGTITYTTISGVTKTAQVETMPKTIEISGAWDVSFPPNLGAPEKITFNELISWSKSENEGVRYFSGTATYKKQINIPKEYIQAGQSLELDLGRVRVIAEVIVNGKNLGVLWKAPFRINLGNAVKAGQNDIQINVTNLWPNRLIGDARYPEDVEWGDWLPKSWPDWLIDNTERVSERITFTTWRHWRANDPLQLSGLLGPVFLRPYVHVPL